MTASDLTPELLDAGRRRADAAGLELEWVQADAEHLPFDDESFDVVMSCIGVMFAPHHQDAADELVRVCRPGGTIALLSWTPEGMLGALFRTMGEFAAAAAARRAAAAVLGQRGAPPRAVRRPRGAAHARRDTLEITAFEHARDYGEHFRRTTARRSPCEANARRTGREAEFVAALDGFCDEWNHGDAERAPLREGVPARGRDPGSRRERGLGDLPDTGTRRRLGP